jgi:osmotically-inducible protein OsmY
MRYLSLTLTLLVATLMLGQQPGEPSPQTTPPTFPEGTQAPARQMPPDEKAPPPHGTSAKETEHRVQRALDAEPTLSKSHVEAKADKNSVVLTGTVATEEQHDLAMRIAQSQAADRKIVDRIKVRQQS